MKVMKINLNPLFSSSKLLQLKLDNVCDVCYAMHDYQISSLCCSLGSFKDFDGRSSELFFTLKNLYIFLNYVSVPA